MKILSRVHDVFVKITDVNEEDENTSMESQPSEKLKRPKSKSPKFEKCVNKYIRWVDDALWRSGVLKASLMTGRVIGEVPL